MCRPNECIDDEIGLRRLCLADHGTKLADVQRKEVGLDDLAAIVLGQRMGPFGRDMPEIVIGVEHVDLRTAFFYAVGKPVSEQLSWCSAGAEGVAVAHPGIIGLL